MNKDEAIDVILGAISLEHLFAALLAELETLKGLIPAGLRASETTIGAMSDLYQFQSLINAEKEKNGETPVQHFVHLGDLYEMIKLVRRFEDVADILTDILAELEKGEPGSLDASRIDEIRKFLHQMDELYLS